MPMSQQSSSNYHYQKDAKTIKSMNIEQAQLLRLRDSAVMFDDLESPGKKSNFGSYLTSKLNDEGFYDKVWIVFKLAATSITCTIICFIQQSINVYFVSHLNDKAIVSAVGLGNMLMNTFVIAIMCSFNAVVETFVSQAAGSGDLEICGVYLRRAMVVMTVSFFVCVFIIFNCEELLLYLG